MRFFPLLQAIDSKYICNLKSMWCQVSSNTWARHMLCFARGTAGWSPRPFRSPKSAVPILNPWRTSVSWCLWSKILKNGGFKQPSNLTLSTWNWTTYDSTDYDESIPTKRCLRQSFWAEKMNFAAESASSNMHSLLHSWQICIYLKEI